MKTNYFLESLVYATIIVAVSGFLTWICGYFNVVFSESVSSNAISAIVGYSFTALFFLMALPRTGFIKKIDDNGSLVFYGFFVGMPTLLGILQFILSAISVSSKILLFLFLCTSIWFLVSAIFIFLIIARNKNDKKEIHKSL